MNLIPTVIVRRNRYSHQPVLKKPAPQIPNQIKEKQLIQVKAGKHTLSINNFSKPSFGQQLNEGFKYKAKAKSQSTTIIHSIEPSENTIYSENHSKRKPVYVEIRNRPHVMYINNISKQQILKNISQNDQKIKRLKEEIGIQGNRLGKSHQILQQFINNEKEIRTNIRIIKNNKTFSQEAVQQQLNLQMRQLKNVQTGRILIQNDYQQELKEYEDICKSLEDLQAENDQLAEQLKELLNSKKANA